MNEHFAKVAVEVDYSYVGNRTSRSVLDIGSNDGAQLKYYKALGYSTLGFESSKSTAAIANENGIEMIEAFFNKGAQAIEMAREPCLV